MKIALKYGLLITLGVIAWVVIAHLLVPDPRSPVHSLGPLFFFNLLEIAGIYFGIKARQNENAGELSFKTAIKTGVSIALVYGVSASLFFTQVVLFVPQWLASEPGAETMPVWQVALRAFIGLSLGALIFGLVYSTVISFFLAKRQQS